MPRYLHSNRREVVSCLLRSPLRFCLDPRFVQNLLLREGRACERACANVHAYLALSGHALASKVCVFCVHVPLWALSTTTRRPRVEPPEGPSCWLCDRRRWRGTEGNGRSREGASSSPCATTSPPPWPFRCSAPLTHLHATRARRQRSARPWAVITRTP